MTAPTTAANPDSAYVDGGTMFTLIGGYTVTDEINTGAPESTNVPNEVAVANLVNTIETITGNTIHSVGEGLVVNGTQMKADFATTQEVLDGSAPRKAVCVQALDEAIRDHADTPDLGGVAALDADYLVGHYDVAPWGVIETIPMDADTWEIKPGHAYKLLNILGPIELTATACPADGFGTEAHIEVYNMGNGYIHFGPTIVIGTESLVANAVNDCTVRFHGGIATLQVEDVISGIYDVTTASSSGDGSLDDAFNVGSRFVHIASGIVGNAVFETAVTSAKDAIVMDAQYVPIVIGGFKTQGTNTAISINESTKVVTVTAGTFKLADYTIPSGSTVAASGGGLAVEKVTGAGSESIINLGGTILYLPNQNATMNASGVVITGGSAANGGAIYNAGKIYLTSCTVSGNIATSRGGAIANVVGFGTISGCSIHGNVASQTVMQGVLIDRGGLTYADSYVDYTVLDSGCYLNLKGSNRVDSVVAIGGTAQRGGTVTLTSGATLDLTNNTNTTPIFPGGGVSIQDNVHILYNHDSAGTTLPTTSVTEISGGTYGGITNYGVLKGPVSIENGGSIVGNGETVIDLNGTNVSAVVYANLTVSGCIIASGIANYGGAFNVYRNTMTLTGTTVTGCIAYNRGGAIYQGEGLTSLTGCIISGNTATEHSNDIFINSGGIVITDSIIGEMTLDGNTSVTIHGSNQFEKIVSTTINRGGTVTLTSSSTLDLTSNSNPTPIAPGGGISFASGGATVLVGSGTASSSYMLDNVTLPAGARLTNTAVVNLAGSGNIFLAGVNNPCVMSGVAVTSGIAERGGGLQVVAGSLTMLDCIVSGNSGTTACGGVFVTNAATVVASNCTIYGAVNSYDLYTLSSQVNVKLSNCIVGEIKNGGGLVTIAGNNNTVHKYSDLSSANHGNLVISSGASLALGTAGIRCSFGGVIQVDGGTCMVNTHVVGSGTYTQINSNGTTVPATDADGNTNPIA